MQAKGLTRYYMYRRNVLVHVVYAHSEEGATSITAATKAIPSDELEATPWIKVVYCEDRIGQRR